MGNYKNRTGAGFLFAKVNSTSKPEVAGVDGGVLYWIERSRKCQGIWGECSVNNLFGDGSWKHNLLRHRTLLCK